MIRLAVRLLTLASLVSVALATAPLPALADEAACTKALGRATGVYLKNRRRQIAVCEDKRSKGVLPSSTICRPQCDSLSPSPGAPCRTNADCGAGTCLAIDDARTAMMIAGARDRATARIESACAGLLSLPPVGPACDASAATAAALAACVTDPLQDADVEQLNVDTLAATVYDAIAPVTDDGLRLCQATISRESGKYLVGRYTALRACNEKLARGATAGPCPDAATVARIESRRAQLDKRIRARCSEAQLAASTPPNLEFGVPCEEFKFVTFKRDGATNNNLIPVVDRFLGCITDATAAVADRMLNVAYAGAESSDFAQGVAAGDATDTQVVFWTRLPDDMSGALLDLAADPAFSIGLQTIAVPVPASGDDGTVKVDVGMLFPSHTYYYRFRQGGSTSPTGKVRTAPASGDTATVRFGWSGDANAFFRPFTVLDPVRLQDPDAWFFIGDTIYGDDPRADGLVAFTTDDYYAKYRENREDAALRNLIGAAGTYAMWDDHEVRNDFAGAVPAFATRMANGTHAFLRYNPIREDGGDPTRLYRSFKWGTLAEFFLIDVRQYRSAKYTCCNNSAESGFVTTDDDSTCTTSGELTLPDATCTAALETPGRTVLGAAQKAWLESGLSSSTATFKFIMNGPPVTNLVFQPDDFWIGYPEERDEVLDYILSNSIDNVIWLSTDLHGIVVSHDRVSIGPSQPVPEVVGGAIGMDPIFRELPPAVATFLPTLPSLLTQITQFDIDRFNAAILTVAPGAPATATIDFYDRSNTVVQRVEFDAN